MTGSRLLTPRWLAAGGAAVLAVVIGGALLLQNGGSACAAPPSTAAKSGQATFYRLSSAGNGNCLFPTVPADDLYVALGPEQYSGSAACGTYIDVTGPKGKVRVKVTDSCPECPVGHLDLSRTAFIRIADEPLGRVPITYQAVPRPLLPSPLAVTVKSGSSQYWLAVLIDNHGTQLGSVRVAGPDGTFHPTQRTDYNNWIIENGAGTGPFTINVTDVLGNSAVLPGIKLAPGQIQQTSVRLPTGGTSTAPTSSVASAKAAQKHSPAATQSASVGVKVIEAAASSAPAVLPEAGSAAPSVSSAANSQPAVDLAAGRSSCG